MRHDYLLIHRYGIFHKATGKAVSHGFRAVHGSLTLPHPPPIGINAPHEEFYIVPMDDDKGHWHRLHSESEIGNHTETRHLGHGDPSRLTHSGGDQHPTLAYVRLAGTLTWENAPHPRVKEHMDYFSQLPDTHLAVFFCGPQILDPNPIAPPTAPKDTPDG